MDTIRRSNGRKSFTKRLKECIEYLWISRISIQCKSIPCLIILCMLLLGSILFYIEYSNEYFYYHRTLSFLSLSKASNGQISIDDLHRKVSDNYPNVHVIAGIFIVIEMDKSLHMSNIFDRTTTHKARFGAFIMAFFTYSRCHIFRGTNRTKKKRFAAVLGIIQSIVSLW